MDDTCLATRLYLSLNISWNMVQLIHNQATWELNVLKCCSLDMDPIIFTSAEEQSCLSNYTKSNVIYWIFLFKINLIRKLDWQLELLDGWTAGLQRLLGLVRWFDFHSQFAKSLLGTKSTWNAQITRKLPSHENLQKWLKHCSQW